MLSKFFTSSLSISEFSEKMLLLLFFLLGTSFAHENLKIGSSMNIWRRYGFFEVSMKVAGGPHHDWIFREPTSDLFEDIENNIVNQTINDDPIFNGDFYMEFCDDVSQLIAAYFREFRFEEMDEPWKAFASSWSDQIIAEVFGINITFVSEEYRYIFVRLSRQRENFKLRDLNLQLRPHVKEAIDNIAEGDWDSAMKFLNNIGSHFIASYITGDSIFQVLVYRPPVYYRLKSRLRISGINSLSRSEFYTFFSPWMADHVGFILSASGNSSLVKWTTYHLMRARLFSTPYPSLISLYKKKKLLKELDRRLENRAILSLELRTLTPIIDDIKKKNWLAEVLSNIIEVWVGNMWLIY